MVRPRVVTLVLLFSSLLMVGRASGQPLLERVLERVQDQLDDQPQPAANEPLPPGESIDAGPADEEPGYLGVVADDRNEQGRGVRILDVVAGGPAAQGGLVKNDLITSINDQPVRNMDEMARLLTVMPAGARLAFSVTRGAANRTVTVTLGQRPAPGERKFERFGRQPEDQPPNGAPLPGGERPKLGVRTLPVTQQAQQQFDLPSRDGAIVVAVTPGSPADRAGIRLGAVIVGIDDTAVRNPDQLADLVATAGARGQFTVSLLQDGRQSRVNVSLAPPQAGVIPDTSEDPLLESPAAPPSPRPIPEESDDEARLQAIERRLQQLEDRIEKIEQALEKKT